MEIILRDDDLSYFAEIEYLESLFSKIWDKTPIYFAVIPKVYSRHVQVPQDKTHSKDYYWIGKNKKLVTFLKQKIKEGKVVIWQHGFTHKRHDDKPELERRDLDVLYSELLEGKKHLEKTFGVKVDTIVPPNDRLSKQAVFAIEKIGYKNICRGYSPLPREIQWSNKKYLESYYKLFRFWLKHKTSLRYSNILNFGNHNEIFSYRVQHINRKNIDKILNHHKKGVLCITSHYRSFNLAQKEALNLILENAKRN